MKDPGEFLPEIPVTDENEIRERLRAVSALHMAQPAEAWKRADVLLKEALSSGYYAAAAYAQYLRGISAGSQGDIPAAVADIEKGLALSREAGAVDVEARCLHGLANAYYHQGDYASALESMYRSLALRRAIGAADGITVALSTLAGFHGTLGNYQDAVLCLTEALQLARETGIRRSQPIMLLNLGMVHLECGEPEPALAQFRESELIAEEVNDQLTLANALTKVAECLRQMGRLEEAQDAAQRALGVARALENRHLEATALLEIALIQETMGDFPAALSLLRQTQERVRESDSAYQMATVLERLGRLSLKRGDADEARALLEEALHLAQERDQRQEVARICEALSAACEAMGDFASALAYHRAHHDAELGLRKESTRNLMMAQLARLEVERARQEAEIHRLRNIELAEAIRENADLMRGLRLQADRLAREATEDPLTGLYNRRYLNAYLEEEVGARTRTGDAFALAIADLDNFKQVNDRFGHHIGDEVLKITALAFQRHVPRKGVVARYGGEEFVLALPDASRVEVASLCEKVRSELERYAWQEVAPGLRVTISIGTADEAGINAQNLLAIADRRMYQAKQRGRNRVV